MEQQKCSKCTNITDGKHKLCAACLLRQQIYVISNRAKQSPLSKDELELLQLYKEEFYKINGYHYTPRTAPQTATAVIAQTSSPVITSFTFNDNKLSLRDSRDVLLLIFDFTTGNITIFNEKLNKLTLNGIPIQTLQDITPLINKIQQSLPIKTT